MSGWKWLQAVLFAAVTAYGIFLFVRAVSARVSYIRLGRKEELGPAGPRIRKAVAQMLSHRKLLKDWKSGIMHLIFFYGFVAVQFGALELIVQGFAPSWHWP